MAELFDISNKLKQIIDFATKGALHSKNNDGKDGDITVKWSTGRGTPAQASWIGFLGPSIEPTNGIYPVFLYYKDIKCLFLCYGVSSTTKPTKSWDPSLVAGKVTIGDYLTKKFSKKFPKKGDVKYRESFLFKDYREVSPTTIPSSVESDMKNILAQYCSYLKIKPPVGVSLISLPSTFTSPSTPKTPCMFPDYKAAIKAKPFVILGGFSGTGKSQKVKELAFETCPTNLQDSLETTPGNYCLISVKPNWHDSTELLGYYSGILNKYIVTDFMRFLVKAMKYPQVPFFVCLDEMNLAPVEEYFAEFLSVLETRKKDATGKIVSAALVGSSTFAIQDEFGKDIFNFSELGLDEIKEKDICDELKSNGLCLPQNVIVIGTVNMDDTTYSFSRKVIDRAMSFETPIVPLTGMLTGKKMLTYKETRDSYDHTYQTEMKDNYLADEVSIQDMVLAGSLIPSDANIIAQTTDEINEALKGSPFQILWRFANEVALYYNSVKKIHSAPDWNEIFDAAIMMKILPRIEGDYDKTHEPLEKLLALSTTSPKNWPQTAEKIKAMQSRFDGDSGFTSFWN